MNSGRQLDQIIAKQVFGHMLAQKENGAWIEGTENGERPLAPYSTNMSAAWEVAQKMGITLLPISDGSWFALVTERKGWDSPEQMCEYIQERKFSQAGAAVNVDAPLAICEAALKAIENRQIAAQSFDTGLDPDAGPSLPH